MASVQSGDFVFRSRMPPAAAHVLPPSSPTRAFGRYTLRALIGKSESTMTWLALDAHTAQELMLTMPRVPPAKPQALAQWLVEARRAARLDHPSIATVIACDAFEQWPYVAVDRRVGTTLDEWLAQHPRPQNDEMAQWLGGVLRGLAFAHDAGIAHGDVQPHQILLDERGEARVMAFSVGTNATEAASPVARDAATALDPRSLRRHRLATERDVLAAGLILHGLLAGQPAAGSHDTAKAIEQMAPQGREVVRLPWTTPQPVPEALRAIVNRSTSAQLRLRYRSARTFLGALDGWREAVAGDEGGPVALLIDRLRTVGHLPALPGLAARVSRVTNIESQRTDEIAQSLLPDMALSFELLRTLNSAQVQGTQIAGNGPVLTLRRVVALVGVNGVRLAANSLRQWPGPLDDAGARGLRSAMERVRLAGHAAQALRPAGYDAEVVYLVAVLQNLGRLLLRYHFADEATQIDDLVRPEPAPPPPTTPGPAAAEHAGLSQEAASFAVLGVDYESFGGIVARHWGMGDDVLHMIRRLAPTQPVRKPDSDADLLRIVASAANEAVDALELGSAPKVAAALALVVKRYARTLKIDGKALNIALKDARDLLRSSGRATAAKVTSLTPALVTTVGAASFPT